MVRCFLYARVSKDDKGGEREQDPQWQMDILRAECKRVGDTIVGEYIDLESGNSMLRAGFIRMLTDAKEGKGDLVRVWKIDRFIRAEPVEGLVILYQLLQMKVGVKSLTEPIVDTTDANPIKKGLMWVMICVYLYLGNEEREKTRERTKAAIAFRRIHCICLHPKDRHNELGNCQDCPCPKFTPQWTGGRPKGSKTKGIQADRRWEKKPEMGALELMSNIKDTPQKSE